MCSGRTPQLLPRTHTHTLPSPQSLFTSQLDDACVEMEIALWMRHSEERSTGRSEGSQTAFWDGVQPPTRQMCCAALSLPPTLSGSVFVGETPSWVCRLWCTVPSPCRVNHIFSPSIQFCSAAHRYLETSVSTSKWGAALPRGRMNTRLQNKLRLRVNLQT